MTDSPEQRFFRNCEIESDGDLHWKLNAIKTLKVENCSEIEIKDGFYMSDTDYYEDCCQIQD